LKFIRIAAEQFNWPAGIRTGLLVDDGPDWLEAVEPTATRGKVTATTIVLEDIG
jgi:hypothetical protein